MKMLISQKDNNRKSIDLEERHIFWENKSCKLENTDKVKYTKGNIIVGKKLSNFNLLMLIHLCCMHIDV